MQLPKTTVPISQPATPGPTPVRAAPPQSRQGRRSLWLMLGGLAAIAGGALLWLRQPPSNQASSESASSIRFHTVQGGILERTLRLTGTTQAEKFTTINAPQLRGSRSGFGRDGPSGSFSGKGSYGSSEGGGGRGGSSRGGGGDRGSMGSSGGGGDRGDRGGGDRGSGDSGGGGSSSSASSSSSPSSSSSVASTASGVSASRSTSALRSSTSRVSTSSSSARSTTSSSRSSSGGGESTMGSSGLGSAASTLPGGGGGGPGGRGGGPGGPGGPGGGEFSLTLQNAASAGSKVKKGDAIAEFDRQYMLTRLDDYKSSVAQADSSFRKMQAELQVAKKAHNLTIDSAKAALDKAKLDMQTTSVVSDMDAERLRLSLEEAQARYNQLVQEVPYVDAGIKSDTRVAEIELGKSKVELGRAEQNANRMEMKAAIDGLVVMQPTLRGSEFDQVKVGDQLMPGQTFMQVVDTSSMIINASVNQIDVERLRIGLKARVRFDAFPGLELPARLYSLGSVAKSARYRPDWVKEMVVVLKLEKMDPRVIPDLSVSADVILETTQAGAVLPRGAVFHSSEGKPFVWTRDSQGAWLRREVELGMASFTDVAVKSGLQSGDVVAIERPPQPEDGSAGKPAES